MDGQRHVCENQPLAKSGESIIIKKYDIIKNYCSTIKGQFTLLHCTVKVKEFQKVVKAYSMLLARIVQTGPYVCRTHTCMCEISKLKLSTLRAHTGEGRGGGLERTNVISRYVNHKLWVAGGTAFGGTILL